MTDEGLKHRIVAMFETRGWSAVRCGSIDGSIDETLRVVRTIPHVSITWKCGHPWLVHSVNASRKAPSAVKEVEKRQEFRNRPGNIARYARWLRAHSGAMRRRAA
jgi:hypothetical protein